MMRWGNYPIAVHIVQEPIEHIRTAVAAVSLDSFKILPLHANITSAEHGYDPIRATVSKRIVVFGTNVPKATMASEHKANPMASVDVDCDKKLAKSAVFLSGFFV